MFDLEGRVAMVTGAGSGIGAAVSVGLASRGARVLVADIDEVAAGAMTERIRRLGGEAEAFRVDVTAPEECTAAVNRCVASWGRIDILVNNAGIGHVGTILEVEDHDLEKLLAVNTMGVYHCAQAALRVMLSQRPVDGRIINVASAAAVVGLPRRFAYSTSKGAVLAMTRQLAIDFAGAGIRVNAVCPGTVDTPFVEKYLERFHAGEETAVRESIRLRQPVGRLGTPEEIAASVVYLASDEAAFVNGSALMIDGGLTAQ